MLTSRGAKGLRDVAEAAIHPLIRDRWSPRAFDPGHVIDDRSVRNMLEAARRTPSNRDSQPWRFVVGRRGDPTFGILLDALTASNRRWAAACSALVCGFAVGLDEETGEPLPWAPYDLGQAVAYLTMQAMADGLHTRQMAGFDPRPIRERFRVVAGVHPWIVVAVGALGDPRQLPDKWRLQEGVRRDRRALPSLVGPPASQELSWCGPPVEPLPADEEASGGLGTGHRPNAHRASGRGTGGRNATA